MNYILRNYEFNTDNKKAFEIYSDSTCEHLEYTCNYHDMLEIMQENIYLMANDGLISYREGWKMRDDYIMYNEYVELFEKYGAAIKSQRK